MKTTLFLTACLGMLFAASSSWAQKWADNTESVWEGRCQTRTDRSFYTTRMTVGLLAASPDMDFAAPKLPKPLGEIVEAAFAQLEKAMGTRQGWAIREVHLLPASNMPLARRPELAKKWFYLVSFGDGNYGQFPQFAVTIDGRPGTLMTDKGEAQKTRLPFD